METKFDAVRYMGEWYAIQHTYGPAYDPYDMVS